MSNKVNKVGPWSPSEGSGAGSLKQKIPGKNEVRETQATEAKNKTDVAVPINFKFRSDEVWVQNRYRVHSIFTVCVLSSVTIFSVLVYDFVMDAISVEEMTSNRKCLRTLFQNVDVYFNILTLFNALAFQNGTTCNASDVDSFETSYVTVDDVMSMCDLSSTVFQPYCNSLLSDIDADSDRGAEVEIRWQLLHTISNRVRDQFFDCLTQSNHISWIYPSMFQALLTMLEDILQHTVNCCYNLSSLSSSLQYQTQGINFEKTISHLTMLFSFSNFPNLEPELKSISSILNSTIYCDRNSSSMKAVLMNYQSVVLFIDLSFGAMKKAMDGDNSSTMSRLTRRVVFNCCAVLVGIAMAIVVCLRVKNMADWIGRYARSLEKKTEELDQEKEKTDRLLYQMLPPLIAEQLKSGCSVLAESFDSTSIYFSDIVDFTSISARITPMQVVDVLNTLYSTFDSRIDVYDVYKIETIGDAYMVASGVPRRNGHKHAKEIATMAIDLLAAVKQVQTTALPEGHLKVRIGLNSGPCVAGVVGSKMPRYCLFGDTVNTASRMETSSEPMKIHISRTMKELLDLSELFDIVPRGVEIEVKGKGLMETFWLLGRKDMGEENNSMVCKWKWKPKKRPPPTPTPLSPIPDTVPDTPISVITIPDLTSNPDPYSLFPSSKPPASEGQCLVVDGESGEMATISTQESKNDISPSSPIVQKDKGQVSADPVSSSVAISTSVTEVWGGAMSATSVNGVTNDLIPCSVVNDVGRTSTECAASGAGVSSSLVEACGETSSSVQDFINNTNPSVGRKTCGYISVTSGVGVSSPVVEVRGKHSAASIKPLINDLNPSADCGHISTDFAFPGFGVLTPVVEACAEFSTSSVNDPYNGIGPSFSVVNDSENISRVSSSVSCGCVTTATVGNISNEMSVAPIQNSVSDLSTSFVVEDDRHISAAPASVSSFDLIIPAPVDRVSGKISTCVVRDFKP